MICGNCGHDHTKRKCGCIPDAFWQRADVREAVARSDVTRIVRLLRARTDLTQEAIANMTGLSQGMVSQMESGKRSLRNQTKKSRALEGLGVPQIRPCASEGQLPPQEKRRTVENPPSSLEAETNGLRSLSAVMTHGSELEVVQAFRCADRQMGGGRLYRMVMEFLTTRIGPRLVSETSTPATFTAAAGLTEMAGWMAHDAGHDQAAARHFQNAIRFAQAAEVTDSLAAQIWASRSHLALHLGRPRQAVEFAEQGYQLLNGGEDAALQGRLLAMLARGYALLGETTLCLQALIQAERILSHPHRRWGSEWTSPFDEGSLASEAARCLVDLKDFTAASDHARHALVLRSAERIRARALASLVLARAAVGQRDLEQACALVSQVGTATETLGSVVVADQFRDAVDALAAFHDTEAVSKALPQLQSASDRRGGMRRVLHPGSGEQAR